LVIAILDQGREAGKTSKAKTRGRGTHSLNRPSKQAGLQEREKELKSSIITSTSRRSKAKLRIQIIRHVLLCLPSLYGLAQLKMPPASPEPIRYQSNQKSNHPPHHPMPCHPIHPISSTPYHQIPLSTHTHHIINQTPPSRRIISQSKEPSIPNRIHRKPPLVGKKLVCQKMGNWRIEKSR
jgi:hypothetical protein